MIPVVFENVPVADIQLDRNNPRIRRFLEMYPDPTPEQIYLALGAGGEPAGEGGSSFDKLKNSILSSKGIIQPIIVNRVDGRLTCVEGNTRVAIYRSFIDEGVAGNWTQIPAMVYTNLSEDRVDAIRLQVHLVGPGRGTLIPRRSIFISFGRRSFSLLNASSISAVAANARCRKASRRIPIWRNITSRSWTRANTT